MIHGDKLTQCECGFSIARENKDLSRVNYAGREARILFVPSHLLLKLFAGKENIDIPKDFSMSMTLLDVLNPAIIRVPQESLTK